MSQFAVEFHPLAAEESQAAELWHREQDEIASTRFQRELARVLNVISERPWADSPYLDQTKRVLFRRFPYFIVYRPRLEDVQVIAVAHARRRPGYWRKR